MAHGKVIGLYLIDGTPDSVIEATLFNWNGLAIKIPRMEVSKCERENFESPGVYFLFCEEDDAFSPVSVYICEAENVRERLMRHIADYQSGKENFYWNTAVVFVGRDLDKEHIRYLERRLMEIASLCGRCPLITKRSYRTALSEPQTEVMEEYIDNLRYVLDALGYRVLESRVRKAAEEETREEPWEKPEDEPKKQAKEPGAAPAPAQKDDDGILYISEGEVKARAVRTPEGYVLLKGSRICAEEDETLSGGMRDWRSRYVSEGKVGKGFVTAEDIAFRSPNGAAQFVLGRKVDGREAWKTKGGKPLSNIEI